MGWKLVFFYFIKPSCLGSIKSEGTDSFLSGSKKFVGGKSNQRRRAGRD